MEYWVIKDPETGLYYNQQWNHLFQKMEVWWQPITANGGIGWAPCFDTEQDARRFAETYLAGRPMVFERREIERRE